LVVPRAQGVERADEDGLLGRVVGHFATTKGTVDHRSRKKASSSRGQGPDAADRDVVEEELDGVGELSDLAPWRSAEFIELVNMLKSSGQCSTGGGGVTCMLLRSADATRKLFNVGKVKNEIRLSLNVAPYPQDPPLLGTTS